VLLPADIGFRLSPPSGVEVALFDAAAPVPPEHHDGDALVIFNIPPDVLRQDAARLTKLRWIQSLSAGTDSVFTVGLGRDVVVTSGRGLHDGPVAEHTLALVLAAARRLNLLVRAQVETVRSSARYSRACLLST
jgi:phosphoglycerate dehydrogenase-like enzyme